MRPLKRTESPQGGGEIGNDVDVNIDFNDAYTPVTYVSPKRLRGGGGPPRNPYKNRTANSKRPAANPYANPNKNKKKKERSNNDEEDADNAIESYYGLEDEDAFMDEIEPVLEDIDQAPSNDTTDAVFSDITEGMRQRWKRPVNKVLDNSKDLSLQQLDMDMISGQALKQNPNETLKDRRTVGAKLGEVPVIRAFGVNEAGNSVTVFIHGFTPYCYFALPPGSKFENIHDNKTKIRMYLNQRLEGAARGAKLHEYCLSVDYMTHYKSIMGYESPHTHFFKIMVSVPTLIPTLKRIMEEGCMDLPGVDAPQGTDYTAFECNVPFVLRYMIDNEISGAGWLTLPKKTYQVREASESKTHCQIEVDISYCDVNSRKPEGEWSKVAPLRVLSFDIECQGRKGYFPEAEKDPVIQIANAVTIYGDKLPIVQNVFTLKGCLPIVGAQVISSDTEVDMLMKWRVFLEACDPDVITGYNVQNFDIPYLLDRAETLGKGKHGNKMIKGFAQWGRIQNSMAKMRETTFQSSAFGKRNNIETQIEGRVIFDMLPYMQRNHKLSSYTLNSVCAEYLGQQKEDVHHSIISDLQNGTDEDRHRLAVYCLKDAVLPQRLMDKLSVMVNYVEMARVTGVPMSFLISRGQQIKVFSMILRKCRDEKLLVPTLKKGFTSDDVTYEGATVLDPIKSYYQVPIATLDFASLYPSIMQAYNLCFSTLVSPSEVGDLDPKLYAKSENGHVFVHASVKKGILPTILSELLTARKRAKKDMKNAPTEFERAVQNGRQLALKISANSVYGFTGATVGQLPCVPIASSTTSYGRQLLEKTKDYVEKNYTVANGYKHDAEVVYGDTDSVMVKFGTESVEETFPLAIEAAEKCSKIFPNPILLEFEKVYFPYLLMNKKRYAGLMWTKPEKYDKMDTKGLETVRRDNCALVREVIQTSLNKILIDQNVQGAIDYVKSQISDLLQNKMDISRLVITKSLNKGADYALGLGGKKEDYKMKQAHVELAARMKKRDAGTAPQMGDRVPYVIITGAKKAATYERGEDPIYVLENSLAIDCKWYLTNQLSNPLKRIFEPIIDNVEKSLLQGDHTRKIFIPTPAARKGTLMMFAVKTAKCLGCKAPVNDQDGHLCVYCKKNESKIYLEKLECFRAAEKSYAKLWSTAQQIHGSYHSDIMCTGDGCACQFYRRKKVQADIRLAQEVLDKFGR